MLVFYSVYFRLHYYFPFHRFVKRKTRIRAICPDLRVPEYQGMPVAITTPKRAGKSPSVASKEAAWRPSTRNHPLTMSNNKKENESIRNTSQYVQFGEKLSRLHRSSMKNPHDRGKALQLFH